MRVLSALAGSQAVLPFLALVLSGASKFCGEAIQAGKNSGLSRLLREEYVLPAWWAVGGIELSVGAAGFLFPGSRLPAVLGALILAGAVAYSTWLFRRAPDLPCGCFGAASREPVSKGTIARAVGLGLIAGICGAFGLSWLDGMKQPIVLEVVSAETLVLIVFSREVSPWLRRRSWSILQVTQRLTCPGRRAGPNSAIETLRLTVPWTNLRPWLVNGQHPSDAWREGCWWLLAFEGRYLNTQSTVVFAIHPVRKGLHACRAAVVNDETDDLIFQTST